MTIKEKAKAYDEALERAREYKKHGYMMINAALDNIFPELRESDDERIRKDIIVLVKDWWDRVNKDNISTKEQMIVWLEKQGEQNSVDNVEPKFNIGDWITNKGHSYLIAAIEDDRYLFEIGGYTHEQLNWEYIKNADEKYHLWTIEDARDGDVLVCDVGEKPFIFSGLLDPYHPNYPVAYCGIDPEEIFCVSVRNYWWTDESVKPATKEQRDLLFQKIKEYGYEWDDEKKELKKTETKGGEE